VRGAIGRHALLQTSVEGGANATPVGLLKIRQCAGLLSRWIFRQFLPKALALEHG